MRFTQLYQKAVRRLSQAGIDEAGNDAALLLEWCFGLTRSQLFLHGEQDAALERLACFENALARRAAREPLHYITGIREFWSLDFVVSPAVLIPRPETEFLLDHILSTCGPAGFPGGAVLDMCTGSGVIAVVLALELGAERVVAVDQSFAALQVARGNIRKHRQEGRVDLLCSDLFSAIRQEPAFELIVANPPYVAAGVLASLQPEVRDWEPEAALAAGRRGLDIIERLVRQAPYFLKPGGWLFLEIGADQKAAVYRLVAEQDGAVYDSVAVVSDWAGRPRVLQARKKGNNNG
ncbi:MAG: peptide chain release factor N(5)-glutamine methyltransferase [Deltaproteobacteria bacterium]|nr:peptide chain release factor N(5)-glutamine methyltransferase [Deltaproteobacteria bacterium]